MAEDVSTVVVAFRGTEPDDAKDLFADADLRFTPWPAGGRVHAGFAACAAGRLGRCAAAHHDHAPLNYSSAVLGVRER